MSAAPAPAPFVPPQPETSLLAPHGLRAAAWVTDLLIVFLAAKFFRPTDHGPLLILALFIAYHAVLLWLVQQTPGKALFGLKVERLGNRPTFLWSLARASLGYCAVDLFGIGILPAFFNQDRRCLHDYIFGSRVLFQGTEKVKFRVLLSRLIDYCVRLKAAEEATTVGKLALLWDFLEKLTRGLQWFIDRVLAAANKAAAKAGASVLPVKTAAVAAALTTVTAVSAAIYLPPAAALADWALTPRLYSQPPAGWGICECPDTHRYIGVIYNGQRWHSAGYTCPAPSSPTAAPSSLKP